MCEGLYESVQLCPSGQGADSVCREKTRARKIRTGSEVQPAKGATLSTNSGRDLVLTGVHFILLRSPITSRPTPYKLKTALALKTVRRSVRDNEHHRFTLSAPITFDGRATTAAAVAFRGHKA